MRKPVSTERWVWVILLLKNNLLGVYLSITLPTFLLALESEKVFRCKNVRSHTV